MPSFAEPATERKAPRQTEAERRRPALGTSPLPGSGRHERLAVRPSRLYDPRGNRFEAITERDGDDGSAQWAGRNSLIFMSDRELDTVNLYRVDLDAKPRTSERLTDFGQRDVQHCDVSRDGKRAVIQVWDALYTLDLEDSGALPEPLLLRAGEPGRDTYELKRIGRDVTEAALSPDGQTMAYVAQGRVYVRHMDADSPTMLVTPNSHARHQGVAWSPEGVAWSPGGLRLYFTNDARGSASIFEARVALTRKEIRDAFVEPPTRELLTAPTAVGERCRSATTQSSSAAGSSAVSSASSASFFASSAAVASR